jgi:hypothetical protein
MQVSQPFDAWSFCRDVLVHGAAIEQDTRATLRGYEQHSFRLDAAASVFADRLKPHLGDHAKLNDLLKTAVEYLEADDRESVRRLVEAIREALK